MVLNMVLISLNSFKRNQNDNTIKIKFLIHKETADYINVVITDNGEGYPKFQTTNLNGT